MAFKLLTLSVAFKKRGIAQLKKILSRDPDPEMVGCKPFLFGSGTDQPPPPPLPDDLI